jgi:arginine/lysine/ornithine decarboxylase
MECFWENGVPMSLQAVYACCIGSKDDGSIERLQVYSYLKRLGFIVQRASDSYQYSTVGPVSTRSIWQVGFQYIREYLARSHANAPLLRRPVYRSYGM